MRLSIKVPAVSAFLCLMTLMNSCEAFSGAHSSLVFAVNLSPKPVEVQLTEGDRVIATFQSLNPYEARRMLSTPSTDPVGVRVVSGTSNPILWSDPSGGAYFVRLTSSNAYAALISPDGQPSLVTVHQSSSNDPRICFLNTTTGVLSQVELAPDFNKNIKAYLQNLAPNQPSEFASVASRSLPVFWQTLGQNFTGDYFKIEASDGAAVRTDLLNGHYYLALLGNDLPGETLHGRIQDISPRSF